MRILKTLILLGIMMQLSSAFCDEQNKKILIVYGSFAGSTIEIVDSMSTYLKLNSNIVDTMPAKNSKIALAEYDMVIIGSAIHGNEPHPNVLEFININRDKLETMKVAIFAVCGTITSSKKGKRENALKYPDKIAYGLKPFRQVVFAGNLPESESKFGNFMGKLILGVVSGDYRDWEKIKQWTIETANIN